MERVVDVIAMLVVFVVGAIVGSFLNVCIYRMPLEKSFLWPTTSRCGHCLQPIRWYDNIPLLSYWLLRGRCRTCGAGFSIRYFFVELLTACSFAGLFYLDFLDNVQGLNEQVLGEFRFDLGRLAIFAYHVLLLCFLLVAAFCDLDHQAIPLSLTMTGTVVGLCGAMLFPWPWPYVPEEAVARLASRGDYPWWQLSPTEIRMGLYPWPVWGPLPEWLKPGGNWQTGLATGLAGGLAGTLLLRAVRFLFGLGMGADYMEPVEPEIQASAPGGVLGWFSWVQRVGGRALGLGDADLMMMAGAFLGWQPIVVAFLISVFPGLLFGLGQLLRGGGQAMPFGPALALGIVITFLGWRWIGPNYQQFFFNGVFVLIMVAFAAVGMLVAAFFLRILKLMRR